MKEKINSYFPLWIIVMFPPTVFMLITWNLLISIVALVISFVIMKNTKLLMNNYISIIKLWGIMFILDILSFMMLLMPQIFYKNQFIKDNLIKPLENNPYTNIVSTIYLLVILLMVIFLSKKLINKIILKKFNDQKNIKFVKIVLIIASLPYLFFLPSSLISNNSKSDIDSYKNTLISEKSDVLSIFKYLKVKDYINSYVIDSKSPYTISLYVKTIDLNYKENFEHDAAILFNYVKDLSTVNISMEGKQYLYSKDKISNVFSIDDNLLFEDIEKRYNNSNFKNYVYLDRIGKYDLFDTSEICEETKMELFDFNDQKYYLNCTNLGHIYLFKNNKKYITLKEAIDTNIISKEEIIYSLLPIYTN